MDPEQRGVLLKGIPIFAKSAPPHSSSFAKLDGFLYPARRRVHLLFVTASTSALHASFSSLGFFQVYFKAKSWA